MSETTKFHAGAFVHHKLRPEFKMIVLPQRMTFHTMVRVRELINFEPEERYYYREELELSSQPLSISHEYSNK